MYVQDSSNRQDRSDDESIQMPDFLSPEIRLNKHSENIALFCLWQQNSQGLEEILRGEDCSTCEKTQQGQ